MKELFSVGRVRTGAVIFLAALFLTAPAARSSEYAEEDAERQAEVVRIYSSYTKKFPEVRAITPFEVWEALEKGKKIVLVDVRKRKEQQVSLIPGAITQSEFEANKEKYLGQIIVPYCTIGYRSGRYARSLLGTGFDVRNMAGGILLWAHQIGTLTDGKNPSIRIHVYGERWDLAPMAFEPVKK